MLSSHAKRVRFVSHLPSSLRANHHGSANLAPSSRPNAIDKMKVSISSVNHHRKSCAVQTRNPRHYARAPRSNRRKSSSRARTRGHPRPDSPTSPRRRISATTRSATRAQEAHNTSQQLSADTEAQSHTGASTRPPPPRARAYRVLVAQPVPRVVPAGRRAVRRAVEAPLAHAARAQRGADAGRGCAAAGRRAARRAWRRGARRARPQRGGRQEGCGMHRRADGRAACAGVREERSVEQTQVVLSLPTAADERLHSHSSSSYCNRAQPQTSQSELTRVMALFGEQCHAGRVARRHWRDVES